MRILSYGSVSPKDSVLYAGRKFPVPVHSARAYEKQVSLAAGIANPNQISHVLNEQTDLKTPLCNRTAVGCMSSRVAEAIAVQADYLGLHIPKDLSVICLNCDSEQSACSQRISTVQLPFEQMGRFAAASLLSRIESREETGARCALEPILEHRMSIEPPKAVLEKKIIVVGAINMDILLGPGTKHFRAANSQRQGAASRYQAARA